MANAALGGDSRYLQPRNEGDGTTAIGVHRRGSKMRASGAASSLAFQNTSPESAKYPRQRPSEATKRRFVQPGVSRVGSRRVFQKKVQVVFQDPYSSLSPRMRVGA